MSPPWIAGDRAGLERSLERALGETREPVQPLPPAVFRVPDTRPRTES